MFRPEPAHHAPNMMPRKHENVNKSSSFKFLSFNGLNKSSKKEEEVEGDLLKIPRVKSNVMKTYSFNYPLTMEDSKEGKKSKICHNQLKLLS